MNTAKYVDEQLAQWKAEGCSRPEIIRLLAPATLGWPYVFGARGEECTPSGRDHYRRADKPNIVNKCQVLRDGKAVCDGCEFHPKDSCTRMFDCRGYTYWLLKKAGITINGAGATSQWNDNSNWSKKGPLSEMPMDQVCCVFKDVNGTKEHTGMHLGDGQIIHCSTTVKKGKTTDRGWNYYAVPKGLNECEGVQISNSMITVSDDYPTLRYGSQGTYVTLAQTELIKRGYDLGSYGADGKFGKITEAAVRKFQLDWGLTSDGIIGRKTWAYLNTPQEEKLTTLVIPGLTNAQAGVLMEVYPKAYIQQ